MFKRQSRTVEKTAIAFHREGLSLATVTTSEKTAPVINKLAFYPHSNPEARDDFALLSTVLAERKLKEKRIGLIFPGEYYRLVTIDKPKIPDNEIASALQWKIKDLIDLKAEKYLIALFHNPEPPAAPELPNQLFLTVADETKIENLETIFRKYKYKIDSILISELAQVQVAKLLPEDSVGVVLITVEPSGGLMTFSKNGDLYMARRLDIAYSSFSEKDKPEYLHRLSTEIQRSIDYFDQHYRSFQIKQAIGLTPHFLQSQDTETIGHSLTIPCKWQRLDELFPGKIFESIKQQSFYTLPIGACLNQTNYADNATT